MRFSHGSHGARKSLRWAVAQAFAGVVIIFAWQCVMAQSSTMSIPQPQMVFGRPEEAVATSLINHEKLVPSQSVLSAEIHFESMQYLRDIPENPGLSKSQFLSVQFAAAGSPNSIPSMSYKVDAGAETFFNSVESDYIVHEMEVTSHITNNVSVSAGRKKESWSEMDHRWQLGLWQPQFAIDTLRPEEEGLSGFFLNWSGSNFEVIGFLSPLYIPSQGPNIREDNGSLVSDSRWYRSPSSSFNFTPSATNRIDYHINVPNLSDIVMNPGSALSARLGKRDDGWWGESSWGHKPVNNLLLQRQIYKSVDQSVIVADIEPVVGYHDIVSADLGYSLPRIQASVSFLQDNPETKLPDSSSAIQRLNPLTAYSGQLDWTVPNVFDRSILFQFGYLKVYGGGITDIRSNGQADDLTLFNWRLAFTDAYSVGAQAQLARIMNKPLLTKIRYLYDIDQKGTLMNTEFQLIPASSWVVLLGLDVLGVDDESYRPDSFLNRYRGNSRMYGGMSYVF